MTQANGTHLPSVAGPTKYTGPEPGVYPMRAIDADLGYTAGGDASPPAPQVGVLLEFVDGPNKGLALTWYGHFTEKTKKQTLLALRTLGWTGNDLSALDSVRGEAPCTVGIETDLHGVMRPRVRFVGSAGLGIKNVMTPEQKKAFAASMLGLAETIKSEPATGTVANPGAVPAKFF